MSLQDKIDYLNETKSLIRQSIINKGVDVTEQDTFRSYAGKIDQIQQGGTTPEPTGDYRVRFYDYDGTYKDVWVNEGEDATPPNFDHSVATDFAPALTLQGWNKPYTNITEDTEIGAVYIPTDGKTHFYLQITGGTGKDITLYLRNSENCNIVINWGDGTAEYSSTSTSITASHTFADYGVYHCTIENTSTVDFQLGLGTSTATFCGGNSQQMRDALIAIYLGEKVQINTYSFYHNHVLKYITIPNSVDSIVNYAFRYCRSLINITIPSSATSIGNYAFDCCNSLTNMVIPSSVTSIGQYAFHYCYSLTNVTIPNSVISIGDYAFYQCYSLINITIPNSVTSIGSYVFSNCYSLTNITIPSSVTSIGQYAFCSCYSLTNITIPSNVTNIGGYAFYNCHSLTNITIPSSVTSIGDNAFYQCYSLINITIPSSVTSIGDNAFRSCYSLKKILIEGDTVKTLTNSSAFNGIPKSTIFFVKDELVESYKDATNWVDYADQIMPMSEEANYYG